VTKTRKSIAYQGEPGANSHIACSEAYPDYEAVACRTFEDAFSAVEQGDCALAMIPIENSLAGRVADIHHLMPESNLYIIGEHFLPIHHNLLILPDAELDKVKTVHSHVHALGQCRKIIRELGLHAKVAADTAGAARELAEHGDPTEAAIASSLAAQIYGLKTARSHIEDEDHNMTRFVILSSEPDDAEPEDAPVITSFVFRVRNVPAALYKAMGGFATNGVQMTKLESYVDAHFVTAQFYADIEGHPSDRPVRLALEELAFFTSYLRVLGTYKASPVRTELAAKAEAAANGGRP
jgi:prephenate dehydratase